ncbi:hypothetical protein I552_2110 [Mycobacterium xenopi 3993]|nr:hypothetical protein I552_2110 [Mycobacterium xenopi 3993]
MCQWFNRQYATLRDQIDRLQFNRINPDGKDFDYGRDNIQQQVDIVTGNIDKSLAFLDPRVHALTVAQNSFGDNYFPIYEGEEFFKLYEQLSNVNNGIKAHQPDWFTGRRSRRRSATVATSFAHMCAGRRDDARGCPACLPQMDDLLLVAPLRSRHFSSRRGDAIPGRDDAIAPPAVADSADTLRAAVDSVRSASCAPLRPDPLVESTAEDVNRSTAAWLDHAGRVAPVDDPCPC